MAKKKIEIFVEINNENEFEQILASNFNNIVPADDIESMRRFRDQSEPVYLFITKHKVTKVFRGVDSVKIAQVARQELNYFKKEQEGIIIDRPMYDLDEPTPDEMEWMAARAAVKQSEVTSSAARRAARQSARKRHRAELMVPHLQNLNFVLYWPHCKHAHPELYERWDVNNIIMVGREEVQLTKEVAEDILYNGDAPVNEASMYELLNGEALAICFRLLDTEKHFVSLVRKILYEEIPQYDENKQLEDQLPPMTAFDYYKAVSPTEEDILQKMREERLRQKEEAKEKRARRLSEMQRLARQAIEDAKEHKRAEKEQRKLELLKAGNLTALEELKRAPSEEIDIVVPEELSDVEEECSDEEDLEIGYHPPPGLIIPGFYAPPNDIAKVNGLAILFPKLVHEYVTPQAEFLPPHVLVMLDINKRHKVIDILKKYKSSVLHIGVFKAESPYKNVLIAHTVKEYDTRDAADSKKAADAVLTIMLSVESDLPLLELMDLGPLHVSRDALVGEEECAAVFPIDYGDTHQEFEDLILL